MALDRLKLTSKGYPGGPGTTNLYFTAMTSANMTAVANMITALKALQPINTSWSFPTSGDTIDETTGKIVGGWSVGSAPADIGMTGGQVYAAPCGFLIEWRSSGVVDGRHPMGKTFFVPSSQAAYDNSGQVLAASKTTITAAALSFLSASSGFSIWHRPKYSGKPPNRVLERPGAIVPVISGICASKVIVMRSRRD